MRKIESYGNDSGVIEFTDGSQVIVERYRNGSEYNYADFEGCIPDSLLEDVTFDKIEIEIVKDVGFKLNGHLINCYSEESGYYSTDLDVYVRDRQGESTHYKTTCE